RLPSLSGPGSRLPVSHTWSAKLAIESGRPVALAGLAAGWAGVRTAVALAQRYVRRSSRSAV
ncbi:MAG: hypothetical protein NZ518_10095, partial [Dehalococcoidia bacterium]|nr:hypothetical protein [Dehalococcoidia bacterium]